MLIALLNDTHFGARGDSQVFADYFARFYNEIFFPELEKRQITHIVHLGDIVDRRKYISYTSLNSMRKCFMDRIVHGPYTLDVILGNHDVTFKNTNDINAMDQLFGYVSPDKVRFYKDPLDVKFDSLNIAFVPWICSENYAKSIEFIRNTTSPVLFGHLELKGFEMYRGAINDHGFDSSMFDRFDMVLSGHFHHKSSIGNIHYLGAQYEMTWSDYDDQRGFHIFDTETRQLEYIPNPLRIHFKLRYDDKQWSAKQLYAQIDQSGIIPSSFVKVIVTNKTKPAIFDKYISMIEMLKVSDIQVVEDHLNMGAIEDSDLLDQAQDTMTLIGLYVDKLGDLPVTKKSLVSFLHGLYEEASALE